MKKPPVKLTKPRPSPRICRNIVADEFGDYFKNTMVIHHLDGNPWNNNIDNLIPCTNKEHGVLHRNLNERRKSTMIKIPKSGKRPIGTQIPPELHLSMKLYCVANGMRIDDFLTAAIQEKLKREKAI